MSEFYEGLADILEVDVAQVNPDLQLAEGSWDLLAIVSTIALVDEVYDQGEGNAVRAHLGRAGAAHDLVPATASGDPFDSIFHSAGATKVLPLKLVRDRQLDNVLGANLRGAFRIARAASCRSGAAAGGALVFMSSMAAVCGRPALAAYWAEDRAEAFRGHGRTRAAVRCSNHGSHPSCKSTTQPWRERQRWRTIGLSGRLQAR